MNCTVGSSTSAPMACRLPNSTPTDLVIQGFQSVAHSRPFSERDNRIVVPMGQSFLIGRMAEVLFVNVRPV